MRAEGIGGLESGGVLVVPDHLVPYCPAALPPAAAPAPARQRHQSGFMRPQG